MDYYSYIPLAVVSLLGFIFWLNTRLRQAKWAKRAEMQQQFIDRFSGEELATFLSNEHGRSIFEDSLSERKDQRLKILGGVRTGIVLVCLGIGFYTLLDNDAETIFPATIFLSLGFGFLLGSLVSYKLAVGLKLDRRAHQSDDTLPEGR